MNTFALPALKEKRAQIAGRVISLKKQIARHHKELASLDATITLFDPTYRVGSIRPKRTHRRAKLFKMGELGRLCIDALRRAEAPQDTGQVVAAVTLASGQTKATESLMAATVRPNLAYLARRGKVAQIGKGVGSAWRLS